MARPGPHGRHLPSTLDLSEHVRVAYSINKLSHHMLGPPLASAVLSLHMTHGIYHPVITNEKHPVSTSRAWNHRAFGHQLTEHHERKIR